MSTEATCNYVKIPLKFFSSVLLNRCQRVNPRNLVNHKKKFFCSSSNDLLHDSEEVNCIKMNEYTFFALKQ